MSEPMTRRAFAERLALAAAAPFVALDLRAPWPPAAPRVAPAPLPQGTEPSALAKALAEAIRVRYGERLSTDDLRTLPHAIDARLQGMERLYGVPLTNADEPDFVFAAYRGPA